MTGSSRRPSSRFRFSTCKDDRSLKDERKSKIQVEAIQRLSQLEPYIDMVDVIGIDEGKFYPDLVDKVEEFVRKDKLIIISALDGTFERKPFGQIP